MGSIQINLLCGSKLMTWVTKFLRTDVTDQKYSSFRVEEGRLAVGQVLAIFLAALAIRFLNIVFVEDIATYAFADDSPIYWDGAKAWLDSGFFSREFIGIGYLPETERVPLYHLFLMPFRAFFGDAVWPVMITQSIIDSCTCVLIGLLGAQQNRITGLLAGFLAAAWPNLIIHSHQILSDSLFLFLFVGVLYFAAKFLTSARLVVAVIIGFLCGAAIMTRSIAFYIPISMAISAPFISKRIRGQWRPGIIAGIATLSASLIIVSPLMWRNLSDYGTTKLTAQGGSHFSNWIVGSLSSFERGTSFSEAARDIQLKLQAKTEGGRAKLEAMNDFEYAAAQANFAKQEFKKFPLQSILKAWAYGAALNLGSPAIAIDPRIRSYNRNSLMDSTGTTITERLWKFIDGNHPTYLTWVVVGLTASVLCAALQFGGWILLLRNAFWPAVFGALAIAYFLLVSGPVGAPKYRLPYEPILIIFQAVAILALYKRLRPARTCDACSR